MIWDAIVPIMMSLWWIWLTVSGLFLLTCLWWYMVWNNHNHITCILFEEGQTKNMLWHWYQNVIKMLTIAVNILATFFRQEDTTDAYINRSVQERCNSIANALELRISCTNHLICWIDTIKCIWWLENCHCDKLSFWRYSFTIFRAII